MALATYAVEIVDGRIISDLVARSTPPGRRLALPATLNSHRVCTASKTAQLHALCEFSVGAPAAVVAALAIVDGVVITSYQLRHLASGE